MIEEISNICLLHWQYSLVSSQFGIQSGIETQGSKSTIYKIHCSTNSFIIHDDTSSRRCRIAVANN